jgi:hypothetical protein
MLTTKKDIYSNIAGDFAKTNQELMNGLGVQQPRQATPFTDYYSQKVQPAAPPADTGNTDTGDLDFGDKTPSYQTYQDAYIKSKGWDMRLPDFNDPDIDKKYQDLQSHLDEIKSNYEQQYGKGNQIKSGLSFLTAPFLPTTSKLLNPEKPKINWYDPLFDIGTVATAGAGGLSAGVARKAVMAAGNAAFAAGGAGATAQDWDKKSNTERALGVGLTALPAGLLGLQGKGVIKSAGQAVNQSAKSGILNELATSETGAVKIPGLSTPVNPPTATGMVKISPAADLFKNVKTSALTGKKAVVAQLPGVKQATSLVNPIATSDEPGRVLMAISGKIDDQINGATILAMSKPVKAMEKARSTFALDDQGISHANITQIKPLPNGTQSMALHDMIEYAPWYDFGTGVVGDARRAAIQTIRDTSEQTSKMLEAEGILVTNPAQALKPGQFRPMQGEPGWAFLHRVVSSVKEEAAGTLAANLKAVLVQNAIPFTKLAGESDYAYLTRFAEGVKAGRIQTNPNVDKLLDQYSTLADVKLKKQPLNAHRNWDTVAEGMKAGITYNPNALQELNKQIRGSYELIKKNRLAEAVPQLVQTTTPIEQAEGQLGVKLVDLTQSKNNADTLANYVQRVIRGESLPGGSITILRQTYPTIAQRIDAATKLLPVQKTRLMNQLISSVSRAALVTGNDATKAAQRAKISAQIRLAFQPLGAKANITVGDIVDSLSQTIKDKNIAANAVKQTYQTLSSQQKGLLKGILTDVKNLQTQSADAYNQFDTLRNSLAQKMGSQGTREYGQVVGVPGLSGRYVTSQNNKLGADIATELSQHFGYLADSGAASKAVETAGKIGASMRMFRLGFDASVIMIQDALSLGYDLKNLAINPVKAALGKPNEGFTATWLSGTKNALQSGFGKSLTHLEGFLADPVNAPYVKDFIERGGLVETAEATEATNTTEGFINSLLSKTPQKAQDIAKLIERQTMGRSDALFTSGRVITAINLYKAGYHMADIAGKLDEWAKECNLLTGVLSTRGMGISQGQRSIESALMFMSPRYTRANGAIVADILKNPGSYTAKQAALSLAALIGTGFGIYAMAQKAQGKDITLNPFDGNFGKVEINGNKYYLGGPMADARRLLAVIDSAVYQTSGTNLSLSGKEDSTPLLTALNNKNLLYSQFKSKSSPITGSAIEFISGKDYQGQPVSPGNTVKNWFTPSFVSSGGVEPAAASFTGLSTAPVDKPYELSIKWKDEFTAYEAIPSNETDRLGKLKAAKTTAEKAQYAYSRTQYRQKNPQIEAKLFISGDVSTVSTATARAAVVKLIQDNKIDPSTIKGITANQAENKKKADNGLQDKTITQTDLLVRQLGTMNSTPAPTSQPALETPAQKWSAIRSTGGTPAAVAFDKVWYKGTQLTPQETTLLQNLFKQYPLGQTDFNVWLKQTVRQVFENQIAK